MDADLKRRWVEALRSGDYAQGMTALCQIDSDGDAYYCCLGVLAEVELGEDAWELPPHGISEGALFIDGDRNYYGAKQGHFTAAEEKLIADWNDCGKTFAQIADRIEASPI